MKKLLEILATIGITSTLTFSVVACTKKDDKKDDKETIKISKEINQARGWITVSIEIENELEDYELKFESQSQESILEIGEFLQNHKNKKKYTGIIRHNKSILPLEDEVKEILIAKIDKYSVEYVIEITIKKHVRANISDINPIIFNKQTKEIGELAIKQKLAIKQPGVVEGMDYEIKYGTALIEGKFVGGEKIEIIAKKESKLIEGIATIKVDQKVNISDVILSIVEGTSRIELAIIIARSIDQVAPGATWKEDYDYDTSHLPFLLKVGNKIKVESLPESKLIIGVIETVVTKKPS